MPGFERRPDFRKGKAEKADEQNKAPDMSRRNFLRALSAGTAAAAIGGITGPALGDYAKEAISGKELLKSIAEKKKWIKDTYWIEVTLNEPSDVKEYGYKSSELRLAQQEKGLTMLTEELAKLPPLLLKYSPLKSIALRVDLRQENEKTNLESRLANSIGGIVYYKRIDNQNRKMILNIGGNLANMYNLFGWSEGDGRQTFPHELFHGIDMIDGGEWEALQKDRYRYLPESLGTILNNARAELPGFARVYGALNAKEDKATVYEALSSREGHENILKRCRTDDVLDKKVKKIQTYMCDSSCGLMDAAYWADVFTGRVGPKYFQAKARVLLSQTPDSYHARNPDVSEEMFGKWQTRLREEYSAT